MWRTLRLVIVLAALVGAGWLATVKIGGLLSRTGTKLDEALEKISGRKTRVVEGRAEFAAPAEISELALMELQMSTTRTLEKPGEAAKLSFGTKVLRVHGRFRVKAGYRLSPGISLARDARGGIIAKFPAPEILSAEMTALEYLDEKSGLLNRIQAGDREQIVRELRTQILRDARASGMLEIMDSTLRTRLGDLLGAPVEIQRASH